MTYRPCSSPDDGPGWLAEQLPPAMLLDSSNQQPFLLGFLGIFEELGAEIQAQIDHLPDAFDVTTADLEIVRWLGSWLGVEVDSSLPEHTQRRVVRAAGRWLSLRGTVRGMERFIADATGEPCLVTDEGGIFTLGQPVPDSPSLVQVQVEGLGDLNEEQVQVLVDRFLPIGSVANLSVGPVDVSPDE